MLVKRIAARTHLCSTVYELIARYWSEITTFSYHLAFNAPVRSGPKMAADTAIAILRVVLVFDQLHSS